ncbi:DUF4190 domain-containing protein [Streptomyces sp. NPDC002889]|uniref:DUF4190 domain-containing protein n=1 Tax=Streptomyces sp. NPDC002889 TaxID=3364669 RepID=UPI0036A82F52
MDPAAQGWQPYPQYPQRTPVNGLAITALVVGLVCCVPPLGLILGLIALRQIRRKGERGKGMAVAGVILSSISTLLVLVFLLSGGGAKVWEDVREGMREASHTRSTLDLRKGDCFNVPGADLEREVTGVEVVDCAQPHEGEISGTFTLKKSDTWPGAGEAEAETEGRCEKTNNQYAKDEWIIPEEAWTYYYIPTRRGWRLGDHTVVCGFAVEEEKLEGSLRTDPSTRDEDQLSYISLEAAVRTALDADPAGEFAEDRDGYRAWAEQSSKTFGEQARRLRDRTWPAEAGPALKARAAELEKARGHWDDAAAVSDEDDFWRHFSLAEEALFQETEGRARGALGLSTTPVWDEGTSV